MAETNPYAVPLTEEEWQRIEKYIAEGPATTYLEHIEGGTLVRYAGGVMHPRCYLEIVEDESDWDTETKVDILAGALNGALVLPYKEDK